MGEVIISNYKSVVSVRTKKWNSQRILWGHKVEPPALSLGIREDFLEEVIPELSVES